MSTERKLDARFPRFAAISARLGRQRHACGACGRTWLGGTVTLEAREVPRLKLLGGRKRRAAPATWLRRDYGDLIELIRERQGADDDGTDLGEFAERRRDAEREKFARSGSGGCMFTL